MKLAFKSRWVTPLLLLFFSLFGMVYFQDFPYFKDLHEFWNLPNRLLKEHYYSLKFNFGFKTGQIAHPDIVLLNIDNQTLGKLGPDFSNYFPYLIRVLTNLKNLKVQGILVDVGFSSIRSELESKQLENFLNEFPRVSFSFDLDTTKGGERRNIQAPLSVRQIRSSSHYQEAFYNLPLSPDGKIRHFWPYKIFKNRLYPSLALMGLQYFEGLNPEKVIKVVNDRGFEGEMEIIWSGNRENFLEISFYHLADEKFQLKNWEGFFKDKIILVTPTAFQFQDHHFTPVGKMAGGVIHANILAQFLGGRSRDTLPSLPIFSGGLALLILSMAVVIILPLKIGFPLSFGIGGFHYLFGFFYHLNWDIFPGNWGILFFLYPVLWGLIFLGKYFEETEKSRHIRNIFENFVSKEVLAKILKNSNSLQLREEAFEATILFTDIRGFTAFSENRASSEVFSTLNSLIHLMVGPILKQEGRLDKFIGDSVMAVWGAPFPVEDGPQKAVLSALAILKSLEEFNLSRTQAGESTFEIGIGIHCGKVQAGLLGGTPGGGYGKIEYSVIGDTVNLTSRLEGLCKLLGVPLIISAQVADLIHPPFRVKSLGMQAIKGRNESVEVFTVLLDESEIDSRKGVSLGVA